jgi:hypothetical protein
MRMAVSVILRTIAFLLLGTLAAGAAPEGWKTYSFPEDGFAIDLPAAPEVTTETPQLPIVSDRQYQVDIGAGGYIVSAKRYMPDARLDLWNEDSMVELANAMKGECRMRDAKPATLAPASSTKALSYEMVLDQCPGGTVMKVRMHVVGDRVYQLVVVGVAGVETRPETQAFHDSFKLIALRQPPLEALRPADEKEEEAQQGSRRSRAERHHRRSSSGGRVKKRRGSRRD